MKPKTSKNGLPGYLIACQPLLYAYILLLLPNTNDANDVLQDVNLVM